jgi:hypothetical protein
MSKNLVRSMVSVSLCLPLMQAQAPVPGDQLATIRTAVDLVMVPVVVRDHEGRAIGGLRQENFQLFDKGKSQNIAKFSIETSKGRVVAKTPATTGPTDEKASPAPSPSQAAAAAANAPEHFIAFLFDDIHGKFEELAHSRDAVDRFLNSSFLHTDRAAIFTTSGQVTLEFTGDRRKLQETLKRLTLRSVAQPGGTRCPDLSYYEAHLIFRRNDQAAITVATDETIACQHRSGSPGIARSPSQAPSLHRSGGRRESDGRTDRDRRRAGNTRGDFHDRRRSPPYFIRVGTADGRSRLPGLPDTSARAEPTAGPGCPLQCSSE